MAWYWIVLIVFVYLFGWGVFVGFDEKYNNDFEGGVLLGMIWPIVLPIILGMLIFWRPNDG